MSKCKLTKSSFYNILIPSIVLPYRYPVNERLANQTTEISVGKSYWNTKNLADAVNFFPADHVFLNIPITISDYAHASVYFQRPVLSTWLKWYSTSACILQSDEVLLWDCCVSLCRTVGSGTPRFGNPVIGFTFLTHLSFTRRNSCIICFSFVGFIRPPHSGF